MLFDKTNTFNNVRQLNLLMPCQLRQPDLGETVIDR